MERIVHLRLLSIVLSFALLALYLFMLALPRRAQRAVIAFPRSTPTALVLTVIAVSWAGWHLKGVPLAWLDPVRSRMWMLVIVAIVLLAFCLRELLAVRALGGLLLLLPYDLLFYARFHPSPYRFVIIVLAYIMVIKGALLIGYPYLFRRWMAVLRTPTHYRVAGVVGVVFAALLLVMSFQF